MTNTRATRPTLATATAALLLGVAMPALPALAKEKVKTPPASEATASIAHSVSIPTVQSDGASIDEATLRAILSGDIAGHAEELATLDATSILVPEIIVTVTSSGADGSESGVLTFSDLLLENVQNGVAASVSLAGIDMTMDDGAVSFGTMTASNFSIGGILGVYGMVDSASTEMSTLYTDFASEGGTLNAEEVSCTFGGVSGAEVRARPLKTSFIEFMALAQSMEDDPENLDPAVLGKVLRMYADIFTAFETSEVTFDGFACDGEDDEGRPMVFEVAGMSMGGMSPGVYPALSMDGLKIEVEGDGFIELGNFTFKQMDLTQAIATLQSAPELVDETWLEDNVRHLIPAMEGLSIADLSIDVPDPDEADTRIKATVGAFDLSLANYLNGIPTDFDMSSSEIVAQLPETGGDEMIDQLRALNITSINAGFRLAAIWDEAAQSINIKEVSFNGADLGSVALAGTIANATADLFALDEDVALQAAMSVLVKNLDATVEDWGLSDIILEVVGKEQGSDPATLRPIFADLAKGTTIGMMAGLADASKLGDAVDAFVRGTAKTLAIGITAKNDTGLSLVDFMAAEEDPTSLLGKVNVTATAK
ncbi:MAG: hypothetical protein KIT02_04960 [Devosia sp.]|uniref:hypothetical protein n=1 Tax=Devosia sp. TaxID=1871048 RepID=UPI0024CC6D3B|nr:hypothetical protein [Devosia sp.]UYO00567.1 MAG: hypothetical protein KIT02_04960 [Devosia sp.]